MAFIPSSGSVVAFQSDPTKLVGTVSIVGSPTQLAGSIMAVNFPSPSTISYQLAGSILAVSGSFSSTPQSSITALQLAGSVQAVNMPSPSVIAYQAAGSVMAISGSFSSTPQNSIIALQLAGSVMAVSATVNTGNSSVQLLGGIATIGSVATLQGTTPWIVTHNNNSIFAVIQSGNSSVIQATSPWIISGSVITRPFVQEDASIFRYQGSVVSTSVTAIAASVAAKRFFVTDFWASNSGSVATLLTFADGSTSVLGNFIVPAGGGTNAAGLNIPLNTKALAQDLTYAVTPAVSVLYVNVNGYQA